MIRKYFTLVPISRTIFNYFHIFASGVNVTGYIPFFRWFTHKNRTLEKIFQIFVERFSDCGNIWIMKRGTTSKTKPKRHRFRGIGKHADTLGVSRGHLYLVLAGERKSATLIRRYKTMMLHRSLQK
jgi:hypothetical protein